MMFSRKRREPVCAIAGVPCPRTSDATAERYCPYWSDAPVVETNDAGEERAVEHCTARIAVRAMIQTMRASNGAAASFDGTRNQLHRLNLMLGGVLRVGPAAEPPRHKLQNHNE